ncbi:hypothetical protein [Metabacillus malikii]|uniref:Uncharacterized protein n=1 Tax=Metabacillus malikii TaxID=1504265 RepID=A0ABT9ZHD1_9BACI|nr:hypothetical protein [Metabacillus malikii]MDQ0231702.1 hypothetical protein [Metabacillus malikii]
MAIFIVIILLIYLYDFTKLRSQNAKIIEQNDKIISLLEQLNKK